MKRKIRTTDNKFNNKKYKQTQVTIFFHPESYIYRDFELEASNME